MSLDRFRSGHETVEEPEEGAAERQFQMMINQAGPRLSRKQRVVGAVIRFMDPTMTATVMAVILRNISATPPRTFMYSVTALTWVVSKEGLEAIDAFACTNDVRRYYREMGGGSFAKGIGKDLTAKTVIAGVISSAFIGVGALHNYLFNKAIMDESETLVLLLNFIEGPIPLTFIVGAIALPLYFGGQKLAACMLRLPEPPLEGFSEPRWYQKLIRESMGVFYSMVAGEYVRELFNGIIGFTWVMRFPSSVSAGPVYEAFLHRPGKYYATDPEVFEKLDLSCAPAPVSNVYADDELLDASFVQKPSRCRQIGGLTTRITIAVALMGGIVVLNNVVMASMGDKSDDDRKDPANWSMGFRMLDEGAVYAAWALSYTAAMLVPTAVQKVGRWCGRLFSRRQQLQATDVEMDNRDDERITMTSEL